VISVPRSTVREMAINYLSEAGFRGAASAPKSVDRGYHALVLVIPPL
jgi:hypothetical protein